ncbi:MAG: hypothetical protein RL291_1910 [Pseudomonadota bacterium]
MLSTVIAILSGALVAFGVMALMRDRARREREKLVASRKLRKPGEDEFADVTIQAGDAVGAPVLPTGRFSDPPPKADVSIVAPVTIQGQSWPQSQSPPPVDAPAYLNGAGRTPPGPLEEPFVAMANPPQPVPQQPAVAKDAAPVSDGGMAEPQPVITHPNGSVLPELPSHTISEAIRLDGPVPPARSEPRPSVVASPAAMTQPAQPVVTPSASPTPGSTPALSVPLPPTRTLPGLTIGQLPTRKPQAGTAGPTAETARMGLPGGHAFSGVNDGRAQPPQAASTQPAAEPQPSREKALNSAQIFGTPLVADPPLPGVARSTVQAPSASASTSALEELERTIGSLSGPQTAPGIEQPRSQRVELDFYAILPEVVAAIDDVRRPLERAGIEIGPQGQPTWGARNAAYGTLQRVEMRGNVLAWLICEMDHRGALVVRVVPEKNDDVALSGSARRERGPYQRADIANAAAEALKPVAAYAAVVVPRRGQALSAAQSQHEQEWTGLDPVAREAVVAANTALSSVGALLDPMGAAAFDASAMRMRWPLSVEVGGAIVALMHIELGDDWLDVAVAPSDNQRPDLVRRARTVAQGVTSQALAEVMAQAAWPVIVEARSGDAA